MDADGKHHQIIEAIEKGMLHEDGPILGVQHQKARSDTKQSQLDVGNPHGSGPTGQAFDDLFEINTSDGRSDGQGQRGQESRERVLVVSGWQREGLRGLLMEAGVSMERSRDHMLLVRKGVVLDEADAGEEQSEGEPLGVGQLAAEEEHAEESGGDDLELGEEGKDDGFEVGEREEEEVILEGVEHPRHGYVQERRAKDLAEHVEGSPTGRKWGIGIQIGI